jgi:hypothetical protein
VNLKKNSGLLAVETACPNRDQDFLFRHSRKARVTARPPTRANQPRHHGTTAYIPNLVGTSASGATGSTLSHLFSSRPTPENPTSRCAQETSFVIIFSPITARAARTCPSPITTRAARTRPFFHKPLARISISYLHQTLDFPTRNEFLKLNFKLKGTL